MAILVAINDERYERAVEIAADLAETYDDTLIALHVVPQEDFQEHRESIRDIPEFGDFAVDQAAESGQAFAERVVTTTLQNPETLEIESMGRVGDLSDEVLSVVDEVEPRFLVISGRRRSPTGKAIFGDAAQRILLNASCPVVSRLTEA